MIDKIVHLNESLDRFLRFFKWVYASNTIASISVTMGEDVIFNQVMMKTKVFINQFEIECKRQPNIKWIIGKSTLGFDY